MSLNSGNRGKDRKNMNADMRIKKKNNQKIEVGSELQKKEKSDEQIKRWDGRKKWMEEDQIAVLKKTCGRWNRK